MTCTNEVSIKRKTVETIAWYNPSLLIRSRCKL
ncbi:hypothetical protein PUN28_008573 [Cardiocondyla obscurior]|uniref:Uncharacterized protein n=1 Tax=Cardiocondyla obscurior TaxID=286306 RepID=A0AAW2G1L6_9HYME